MAVYDAVVVGLGGVGSFALRGLAKHGGGSSRFLGVERFAVGHSFGSSHGLTRIYRRAYFEHAHYVPWIDFSLQQFRQLERDHGVSLMQECGFLLMESCALTEQGDELPPYCKASLHSAEQHNVPVETLDRHSLEEKFPQLHYERDMVGVLEPGAGFLRPEKIIETAITEARSADTTEILEHTVIDSLSYVPISGSTEQKIELVLRTKSNDGFSEEERLVETKCLLVSAGAWTGQLIKTWAPYLRPIRQLQAWIDTTQAEWGHDKYCYHNMPSWFSTTEDRPIPLYGLPADTDDSEHTHWIKFGIHGRDYYIADPTHNKIDIAAGEQDELVKAARYALNSKAWNDAPAPTLVSALPCFYTMTPDSHFLIGTPLGYPQTFCVAGLSGHGFKQTPALGQMMVDFALGNSLQRWNTGFCCPSRFSI